MKSSTCTKRLWVAFAFTFLVLASPLAGANYILQFNAQANVAQLGSTYGFQVVRALSQQSDVISTVNPLSDTALQALRTAVGVIGVEVDAEVDSSEDNESSRPNVTLESLADVVAGSAPANYFGAQVRSDYVTQRGTQMVRLAEEQASFGTGLGVVAIIDTGVDTTHPALRGALVAGYDFTRNSADTVSELTDLDQSTVVILDQTASIPLDSKIFPVQLSQSTVVILDQSTVVILDDDTFPEAFGHGTMVAGLVHLIAPTAQIMPLKAFRSDGSANLSDIVRAIRFAADNGANVISMSFDMPVLSPELQAAVTYAESKGAILIAAAGNEGKSAYVYPATLTGVIGVGSVNYKDRRSPFSNYGRAARTSAPGEALVTTFPGNNYAGVWGTSFSTALVSGAVTLMRQLQPRLHSSAVSDCLEAGVQIDQGMGDARLDLVRSLTACLHPDE